jgi:TRAP-type C4-dicarboxylate transport system permease small subunit
MKKAIDLFWKLLSNLTFLCFTCMLAVMILQVFFRYTLKLSVPWTDEASRYFFIWAIFLGSAIAQRNREHIRIDIVVDRLSPKKRRIFNLLTDIFDALVSIAILIGTLKMMKSTYGIFASTIPISFTFIYLALAFGIGIMLALIFRDLFKPLAH